MAERQPGNRWANANKFSDRGKWAEGQVEKVLAAQSEKVATFAYERLPDARAARGAFKAMVADFDLGIGHLGVAAFLEVKETKHDYRLTKDKFEQLPRLRKWALAGRKFVVLVYHSEIDAWRCVSGEFFGMEGVLPSWDLRGIPLYPDAATALYATGWFK